MSAENSNTDIIEAAEAGVCCASCGVAEIDGDGNILLKECAKCGLARYCRDKWLENHRKKHEAIRKKKAAELRDEILFRQPECSHLGDCPICFLPMPINGSKKMMYSCCCKYICKGCAHANAIREEEEGLDETCPFCRKEAPETDKEIKNNYMKRAAANNTVALRELGFHHQEEGDYDSAFKYWTRAAELGDVEAHFRLAAVYQMGLGVEKNEEKERYHSEEAAIGGHPDARYNVGYIEGVKMKMDRAVKHFIIAANLGHDKSMQELKECYKNGLISKDDLAAAFRAHQAAVDATKSSQREAQQRALS